MRYFFHHTKRDCSVLDLESSEHSETQGALAEALDAAREIMATAIRQGRDVSEEAFRIVDAERTLIAHLPFQQAFRRGDD